MNFEEKLRFLRKNKNLSQEELADKLCVSRQAISKWETGTIPDIDNILKISSFFNCSTDYLLKDISIQNYTTTNSKEKPVKMKLKKLSFVISLTSFLILLVLKIFAHIFYDDSHSSYQSMRILIDKHNLYFIVCLLLFIWFVAMSFNILYPIFYEKHKKKNKSYLLIRIFLYCLFVIGTYIMIQEILFYGVIISSKYVILTIIYFSLLVITIILSMRFNIKISK